MKYELFQASAVKAFGHCRDIKAMVSDMQGVLSVVPAMVRKNERLDRERAELKQENAALKAEIERLKSETPDDCMRLPLDADGVPIRIGDTVWYVGIDAEITKCELQKVVGLVSVFGAYGTYIMTRDYPDKAIASNMLTHKQPEPPDSWEKLEEDAKMVKACDYAHAPRDEYGITVCRDCRFQKSKSCRQEMILDMIARAKKLAGIEEQEGE